MNGKTTRRPMVIITALFGGVAMLAQPAQAKDRYYLIEDSYPGAVQYQYVETMPMKSVTIEKPVLIQRTTRTVTTTRTTRSTAYRPKKTHIAARPIRHRTHVVASRPTYSQRTVERTIATEPMLIDRPLWVEQTVEKPVTVERPMIIDKAVEVDRPILVKQHHHLLDFSLF
jgi:hypothetical protein